jgi:hypothetical protein
MEVIKSEVTTAEKNKTHLQFSERELTPELL